MRSPRPRAVRVPKGIDPGFEYRPIHTSFVKSQTPLFDEQQVMSALHKSQKPLTDSELIARFPSLTKPIAAENASNAVLIQAFLDKFGADSKPTVIYKDVTGHHLPLSEDLFLTKDHRFKLKKNNRHLQLNLLVDVIQDPDEIWFTVSKFGKKYFLRRRYLRLFTDVQNHPAIAVFEQDKTGWCGVTVFPVDEINAGMKPSDYMQTQRVGTRIYTRGGR